ncbi:Predicted gene 572 [Apodemus speciosus]|uniref:Predicted gene 572 n=1 Tax=Apodemus speciosus TaxID=105296 RepID=A0ABQ0EQC3_APOSI
MEKVECFSDYMTLQIPRSHVQGLRQWLAGVLRLPGAERAPNGLDSLLTKCGYLLHPAHEGGFVFRALYSGCFVQKEKTNYRLEIRMFHKGAKRLKQSHRYTMTCPMTAAARLAEQSVRCYPSFIQVSRPWPPRTDGGQTPWLLSLRGELVASLEDASLMGLEVDIGATTITIQSPRRELLQRQEVRNTSLELLPLRLVSGSYAYSFEAACPLVSSQPGSEISVHIPKQRLGLVKRGSLFEESLSPRFLQVQQSDTFTVAEDRDFVVVSMPATQLLQDQPCQEARESPATQASYRVDLSLDFAEMRSPVHWTVENFFQCVELSHPDSLVILSGMLLELAKMERLGYRRRKRYQAVGGRQRCFACIYVYAPYVYLVHMKTRRGFLNPWNWSYSCKWSVSASDSLAERSREESLVSTVTPGITLPTLPSSRETTPAERTPAASSQLWTPRTAALEEPPQDQLAKEATKQEQDWAEPLMQMTRPAGGSPGQMVSPSSSAMREHQGPQTPPEEADLSPHPQTPATLSSEHTEGSQAGPDSPSTHLSSEIPSAPWPSWPSDGPPMLPSSEPSVTLTEVPRGTEAGQDSVQPSGSPFPPGESSSGTVDSTESVEPIPREPSHISEEFPPLTRPFLSSLAEEGLVFHHDPRSPQERLIIRAEGSLQADHGPSGEEARGHLDLSTSQPSQGMTGLGLTILLGTRATFTTSRGRQPDARAYLGTSSPEPTGRPRVGPAALQTTPPKGLLLSTPEKPAAPAEGAADRTLQLESAPSRPEDWRDLEAAYTASPLPSDTQSLLVPTEPPFPRSGEPENTLPGGQASVDSRLVPTAESRQSAEL